MEVHLTPTPLGPMLEGVPSPRGEDVITTLTKGSVEGHSDDGALAALIGGIVGAVLLVLICVIALLLWCLSRHKGSYVTNEMDDDNDIVNEDEDESVGSDMALQTKEPLMIKEEE
ncbi:glycophorin-C [Trachinotus anak]|uniref:glycophorin-C n=1 Tax=Trachinotus anak TaxID=443729 RepID=UPI0039F22B1A